MSTSYPHPGITTQRVLGLSLIALQCAAVWVLSRSNVFCAFIVVLSVAGAFSRWRFTLTRQRAYDVLAVVALIFVGKYILVPDNPRYTTLFGQQQIMYAIAQYLMTLQCLLFLLRSDDNRLPLAFPGLGIMGLVLAAVVQVTDSERFVFQGMCVAYILLVILFCSAWRRSIGENPARLLPRRILLNVSLALIAATGWVAATMLHRYERQMDEFVLQFIQPDRSPPTQIGFSETPRLGSVALQRDSPSAGRIALRIIADNRPGYLRARAFDEYHDQQWHATARTHRVSRLPGPPSHLERSSHAGGFFELQPGSGSQSRFEFWPATDLAGVFAMPADSAVLQASPETIVIDQHGVVRTDDIPTAEPYSVLVNDAPPAMDSIRKQNDQNVKNLFLRLPDWAGSDRSIRDIADSIFVGAQSDREKIDAVVRYLRSNGRYDLNVTVPANSSEDPVQWFLKNRPAAHCEFFASAATILLRLSGVRCRFVTGFVADERNDFSGEWIVRNRDAHAWVEAFDSEAGWVTVEATPSQGVPQPSQTGTAQQLHEFFRDRIARWRMLFRQNGVRGLARELGSMLVTPPGMLFALILVGGNLWYHRKRFRRPSFLKNRRRVEQHDRELTELLAGIDRVMRKVVRPRKPAETLVGFAGFLETTADSRRSVLNSAAIWYRDYAAFRYSPARDQGEFESLADRAKSLRRELRQQD